MTPCCNPHAHTLVIPQNYYYYFFVIYFTPINVAFFFFFVLKQITKKHKVIPGLEKKIEVVCVNKNTMSHISIHLVNHFKVNNVSV